MVNLRKLTEHRAVVLLLVGVLCALLVFCTLYGGSSGDILGALPAILLAVALAFGRYPGEDVILRFASRRERERAKAPAAIRLVRPSSAACSRHLAFLAGSRSLRGPPARLPSIAG